MTKIDSQSYEPGERMSTKEAITWMADGNVAISDNVKGTVYRFDEDNGFGWVDKHGAFGFGVHFTATNKSEWRKAVLIRKAISWEDAVRAMLDGKHVLDKGGEEWAVIDGTFCLIGIGRGAWVFSADGAPFYLTPPPSESKPVEPRRKVSREDAIYEMVRDPKRHCWSYGCEYRWSKCDLCVKVLHTDGTWVGNCGMDTSWPIYLDPPEAK